MMSLRLILRLLDSTLHLCAANFNAFLSTLPEEAIFLYALDKI